jgi:hypothetical protein
MRGMKICVVVAALVLTSISGVMSQDRAFEKGNKFLQGGIGLGVLGATGSGRSMMVPPMYASVEYGFNDFFSGGIVAGLSGFRHVVSEPYDWKIKYVLMTPALKGAFHPFGLPALSDVLKIDNIDPYAGILAGWTFVHMEETHWPATPTDLEKPTYLKDYFQFGFFVGCRYYLLPRFGLFLEAGPGWGFLDFGATIKF